MPGQFCTLGSSSASDYCVRAAGIQPMHCRIGCRQNGGFIECFSDATINIGGTNKNRSRLTNGNVLKVGNISIEVIIELPEGPAASFDIAFDHSEDAEIKDSPKADAEQPVNRIEPPAINPHVERGQPSDKSQSPTINRPSEKTGAEASSGPDLSRKIEPESNPSSSSELASEGPTATDEDSYNSSSAKTNKPVFEFDSVDPSDIKLTEGDLDAIENMDGNSLLLGDFGTIANDALSDDPLPVQNPDQSQPTEMPPPNTVDSESQNLLPGGTESGRCCHWTGSAVRPTLELLEQHLSSLHCFDIQSRGCLVQCSFGDVKQAVSGQSEPKIFLVSEKSQDYLIEFLASKRWHERFSHPQALSMFLALLPAKHIKQLFAEINTCVLVQHSDVEVVRFNRKLDL